MLCEPNQPPPLFPTKAARKHFEIAQSSSSLLSSSHLPSATSNDQKDNEIHHYLKPSLPDLKDAVRRVKNRSNSCGSKKAKKASDPKRNQHNNFESGEHDFNYPQPNPSFCAQPQNTMIPLTWTPSSVPDYNAMSLINCFLNYAPRPDQTPASLSLPTTSLESSHHASFSSSLSNNYGVNGSNNIGNNCSRNSQDKPNQTFIYPCPAPALSSNFFSNEGSSPSLNSFTKNALDVSHPETLLVSQFSSPDRHGAQVFQNSVLNGCSNNISNVS